MLDVRRHREADRPRARKRSLPGHSPDGRRPVALARRDKKPPGRITLALFEFPGGTLALTEAGTKRRASLHVVRGDRCTRGIRCRRPGNRRCRSRGIHGSVARRESHAEARVDRSAHPERHRQRVLRRDPAPRQAVADRAYAKARRRGRSSGFSTRPATFSTNGPSGCAPRRAAAFPEKVTAFRPQMAVHGKFRQPCPVCGTPVQRIVYADNECNYCPVCQTGGNVLADRALSRLLHKSWPRDI